MNTEQQIPSLGTTIMHKNMQKKVYSKPKYQNLFQVFYKCASIKGQHKGGLMGWSMDPAALGQLPGPTSSW